MFTIYRRANRKLCAVGLMPNKCNPANLLAKISKYNGSTSTYTSTNANKRSWFAMDIEQPPQQAAEVFVWVVE